MANYEDNVGLVYFIRLEHHEDGYKAATGSNYSVSTKKISLEEAKRLTEQIRVRLFKDANGRFLRTSSAVFAHEDHMAIELFVWDIPK